MCDLNREPEDLVFPLGVSILLGIAVLYLPFFIGIEVEDKYFLISIAYGCFVSGIFLAKMWETDWRLCIKAFSCAYPLKVFFEIIQDPNSHNLWPIELLPTIVFGLMAFFGAILVAEKEN